MQGGTLMRLGSWTHGYGKMPIEESLAHMASVGYDGCELSTGDNYSTPIDTLDDRRIDEIRALYDKHRMVPTAVTSLFGVVAPTEEQWQEQWRKNKLSIDLAVKVGAPFFAFFAGDPPEGMHREQLWEMLRTHVAQIADYAGERGIIAAMEPHWGSAVERPGDIIELIDAVGSPALKINLDVGHPVALGYDLESIAKILGPRAVYAHVCDIRGRYPGDLKLVNVGDGEIDWAKWLGLLHGSGYYGWITVQISHMVSSQPGYDPKAANEKIYQVLTEAMAKAEVPRV
jgi:sugar phosphate isomerase/epimerase